VVLPVFAPAGSLVGAVQSADRRSFGQSVRVGDVRDLRSAPAVRRADARAERDELVLAARRTAPRAARHWIMNRVAASGVYGSENQVIELLTGEVVANAVVHGPEHGRIRVGIRVDERGVLVSVTDESPATPVVRHPEPTAVSGRGMALVEALAQTWGVDHQKVGKTVWFLVATEPD
jgi:serine/threonine-protein kinase RsbW